MMGIKEIFIKNTGHFIQINMDLPSNWQLEIKAIILPSNIINLNLIIQHKLFSKIKKTKFL